MRTRFLWRSWVFVPLGLLTMVLVAQTLSRADGHPGWLQVAQGTRQTAPARRGLSEPMTIRDRQQKQVGLYTASHALVIGVSAYTHWPQLPGVRQDVEAVTALFATQGFQVEQVLDPTHEELRRAFDTFINTHGQEADHRLLIYFAGHGHTLKPKYGGDMGYILPKETPLPARDEVGFRARAVSMQEMETYARRIQSKHVLFLFDSCFSGAIFALGRAAPEYITYSTTRPVRQFISSGQADEQVPDVSIFRQQLVAALQGEADADGDGYVTGGELGLFLQKQVVNYSRNTQHPQYGKLRDPHLDKGDFVFTITRPAPPPGPSLAELEAQVEKQRQQVREEQARLERARQLREEQARLQAEQERVRREREQLQRPSPPPVPTPGPQVAVGVPSNPPTLRNSIGMEFVRIEPGTFQMGSNDGNSDEKPVHTVRIGQMFYLGKHEVTQAQWQAVMGNNPSHFRGDTLPVENVSWNDVQEFLRRLNAKEGGKAVYRLPSEAEWEYAARAGSTTTYSFGNSADALGRSVWYLANAGGTTHPVGTLQPNAWGLYDMHGNVWEWVQDCYHNSYNGAPTDGKAWETDKCTFRVVRGGAFASSPAFLRSARRGIDVDPDRWGRSVGFRCARVSPSLEPLSP